MLLFDRSSNEKRSAEPRPLQEPRPRGTSEQHLADAPIRGALVQAPLHLFKSQRLKFVVFLEAET